MTRPQPPGLQAERTALAWQRTSLSALVLGALLLHSWLSSDWTGHLAALGCVTALIAFTALATRRTRNRRSSPRLLLAATCLVCATAGLVLINLPTNTG